MKTRTKGIADESLTLADFGEHEHAFCFQIRVAGHWCGATHDDRWTTNRSAVIAAMSHSPYQNRLVERLPYQSQLQFGPVLEGRPL